MKRFLIAVIAILITGLSMDAQVVNNNSDLQYRGGAFYQNGVKLTADQFVSIIGQDCYDNVYKPAKNLRTAGIVVLSVGGAATVLGAGMAIGGAIGGNSKGGNAFGGMVSVGTGLILGACGAVTAAVGGILMGTSSKKMKGITPAASGAGLAFAF